MTSNDSGMAKVISRLKDRLRLAWCKETAYKGVWDPANPALNQCAVTALAVQTLLGGEIVQGSAVTPAGDTVSHYWNRIADADETYIDLTVEQFPEGTLFRAHSAPTIGGHASVSEYLASNADTVRRYELLLKRLGASAAQAAA